MNPLFNGNFDIINLCASINCDDEQKEEALKRYVSGKSDSFLVDVSLASNETERTLLLWYNTTYIHESRHVHDYLCCPALNQEYQLRILSIIYTMSAIKEGISKDSRYNTFPVPAHDWFHLDLSEKRELLEEWSTSSFTAKAPLYTIPSDYMLYGALLDPGFEKLDSYTQLLLNGSAHFEEYNKRLKRQIGDQYNRVFSLRSMLEASAIASQLASGYYLYGDEGYFLMTKTIADSTKQETCEKRGFNDYSFVFSYISQYIKYQGLIDHKYLFSFTAIVINWSLTCNTFYRNQRLDPVMRFRVFIENDYAKGMSYESIISDIEQTFIYWDQKYNDGVFDITKYNLENRAKYQEIKKLAEDVGLSELADYVEMIAQASQRDTLVYMDNPLNYILPELFIKNFHTFSNIPVKFSFAGNTINFSSIETGNYLLKNDEIIQHQIDNGSDAKVSTISTDRPHVALFANEPAQCSKHIELRTEVSNSVLPYAQLIDAVYGGDSVNTEILKMFLSPLELKYLLI